MPPVVSLFSNFSQYNLPVIRCLKIHQQISISIEHSPCFFCYKLEILRYTRCKNTQLTSRFPYVLSVNGSSRFVVLLVLLILLVLLVV